MRGVCLMNMINIKSSNIDTIGYDKSRKALRIHFFDGKYNEYINVPKSTYKELISASSKGKYYFENIQYNFPLIKLY